MVDELNLVLNLGSTEDGQEGPLGGFERLGEKLELLLHQEPGGSLGKLDADHGRVSSVSGTKGVVDVDRSERGERLAEGIDGGLVGYPRRREEGSTCQQLSSSSSSSSSSLLTLDLFTLAILGATLLLGVESEVLEEEDLAVLAVLDGLLGLGTDTVREESDGLAEQLGELVGLQRSSESVSEVWHSVDDRGECARTTGLRLYFSTLWPSGRPKWDIRTIEAAPGIQGRCSWWKKVSQRRSFVAARTCGNEDAKLALLDGILDGRQSGDDSLWTSINMVIMHSVSKVTYVFMGHSY